MSRPKSRRSRRKNRVPLSGRPMRCEPLEERRLLTGYTVTVNTDAGVNGAGVGSSTSGDLRYCINAAIADGQTDTISFASNLAGDTIGLSSSLVTNPAGAAMPDGTTAFVIGGTSNITINGAGAPGLTISGGGGVRLFDVTGTASLALENLTLAGGNATGGKAVAAFTVAAAAAAGLGVAVYDDGGGFTAMGCTFTNNTAAGGSGGSGGRGDSTPSTTMGATAAAPMAAKAAATVTPTPSTGGNGGGFGGGGGGAGGARGQ